MVLDCVYPSVICHQGSSPRLFWHVESLGNSVFGEKKKEKKVRCSLVGHKAWVYCESLKQVTSSSSTINRIRARNHKRREATSIYAICCFLTYELLDAWCVYGIFGALCGLHLPADWGDESANIYFMVGCCCVAFSHRCNLKHGKTGSGSVTLGLVLWSEQRDRISPVP